MKLLAALLLTAQLLIVPVIQVEAAEKRPLIIFFSLTGNTNAIAAETARLTGGDLFRIVQAKPYPMLLLYGWSPGFHLYYIL